MKPFLFFLLSFFIVAFGQPHLVPWAGVFASCVGLALFWKGLSYFSGWKKRFFLSSLWFFFVQLVQVSWMGSIEYMGGLIFFVLGFVALFCSLQFGLLSLFVLCRPFSLRHTLAAAGLWTLLEWSRLLLFTGFPWNPLGFSLASHFYGLQFASLLGVYGLSFWVVLLNALAFFAFFHKEKRAKRFFAAAFVFPLFFAFVKPALLQQKEGRALHVAIVQTGLKIEQKEPLITHFTEPLHPLEQWSRIFSLLPSEKKPLDLLILPEGALPFGAFAAIYPQKEAEEVWKFWFKDLSDFPRLERPFVKKRGGQLYVSNAFFAKALSQRYSCHVIIGLDHREGRDTYNAAFHFSPKESESFSHYEKRVLVPVGEYIPFSGFSFVRSFLKERYGIEASFSPGKKEELFFIPEKVGISICAEEVYSSLLHKSRVAGAEFFISLSNNAWFPGTFLPKCHQEHARLRAVENGVFLLRSGNTGITSILDCWGRSLAALPESQEHPSLLVQKIFLKQIKTPYLLWGDGAIFSLSIFFLLFWRKRLP